uniref:Uncharacterized protein n=1 Tax=Lepeophtheirus salmonis TaxID=72036 RepID=A0A0K2TCS6_LEPSM
MQKKKNKITRRDIVSLASHTRI